MFRHGSFESQAHAKRSRLFQKGDIKYVILDLLKEKPSHGYEIMRALEERSHGFYSPSAGSVYPTLQLLEDMGYLTSATMDGKKQYSITDEGKRFLTEREEVVHGIRNHMHGWWAASRGEELGDTVRAWADVARVLRNEARRIDRDRLSRIKEIIAKAGRDIENVIAEEKERHV